MLDRTRRTLWLSVFALCALFGSRLIALESLPLHNDEGLHLTRAVQVWRGYPFWEISDGKIVNHWLIALFYPQQQPVFSGRIATVLTALIGLASGIAISKHLGGLLSGAMVSLLWIGTPFLFFYERTALSDSQAAAWSVLAVCLALRLARAPSLRTSALCGTALALAALFKLTAASFALSVALIVLLSGTGDLWRRLRSLLAVAATVSACFSPVLAYLALRGGNFDVAFSWLASGSQRAEPLENLERLSAALLGFGEPLGAALWLAILSSGALAALVLLRRSALIAAIGAPLVVMLLISVTPMPRHFLTYLPLWIVVSGVGLGALWRRTPRATPVWLLVSGALALNGATFALTAYRAPEALTLPALDREQFITGHSSGFALREAMQRLPELVPSDVPIIGSLFPDSCRRANFYAVGRQLQCADRGGAELLTAYLQAQVGACLLAELPPIGIPMAAYAERAHLLARFERPQNGAPIHLWCVAAPSSLSR
jgi:4-amino-4-deoxy-L-arabinose transferase-like glycosyltransferase